MNVTTEMHPYLDGKPKRMLIDGKWLEAASGKTFETRNPATGEVLAKVAEDIDRAVAAARAAFNGPWGKFKPAERQRLLLRLAELVERDIEEFAALDTLDMGHRSAARATIANARWGCCGSMLDWPARCMARRSIIHCAENMYRLR